MTTLNWISSSTPPSNTTSWMSVCYGDNKFVAVGYAKAAYSSTGSSWTLISVDPDDWISVAFGNSLFVAVSNDSSKPIMYSSNGTTGWSTSNINGAPNVTWTSICYGEPSGTPTFVAVSSYAGTNNVMISTNMSSLGGSWTSYPIQNNIKLRSVCYGEPSSGNQTFVAVGESIAVYSTDSGLNWTIINTGVVTLGTWSSVCYGNGIFMAVGTNLCMTSNDGSTWVQQNNIPSGIWYSVCYADNGTEQVFVVTDGNVYVTSADNGTSWTPSPSGGNTPTGEWLSIAYNPNLNYLASVSSNTNQNQGMYAVLCFKEGSKILTDKGYVFIENLKKGDSVQTLKDGFKKIVFLGKKKMEQNGIEERIKDQLYKYTSKEYPELFEDLVLTGGHSILLDNLSEKEKEDMRITMFELFKGEDFIIDDKKCLLSYLNNKAEIYEKKGEHTIYHFALEGDYYKNYGVYANGLLVEACSQHVFLEYVHPETKCCKRTLFYLLFILTHFNDITEFIKSKSMGLLKMRRKLKNEKIVNEKDYSEFHSVF
jgi:hypothetical protein